MIKKEIKVGKYDSYVNYFENVFSKDILYIHRDCPKSS
jgi:hypothetical protein